MLLFWLLAGALAAGAALLAAGQGAAAVRRAATPQTDPALAVHARQLAELDELHRRGLLADAELQSARAEAGRRLLAAADREAPTETAGAPATRTAVTVGAAATALLALALYLALGRPSQPDQPYRARVAAWTRRDPASLEPAQLAAVLRALAPERPRDPQLFEFLGRAELASGDPGEASTAFRRAGALQPDDAEYPAAAAEALLSTSEGRVTPEAEALLREALRRDPRNASARFHLGRLAVAQGDSSAGVAAWKALASELAAGDPRRPELLAEIARVEGAATPSPGGPTQAQVAAVAQAAPAGGPEQQAFIRGMVDRLASRLANRPDDVDGWARLVRAYGVLGDDRARADALTRARTVFARRPADLARIEAEARPASAAP